MHSLPCHTQKSLETSSLGNHVAPHPLLWTEVHTQQTMVVPTVSSPSVSDITANKVVDNWHDLCEQLQQLCPWPHTAWRSSRRGYLSESKACTQLPWNILPWWLTVSVHPSWFTYALKIKFKWNTTATIHLSGENCWNTACNLIISKRTSTPPFW